MVIKDKMTTAQISLLNLEQLHRWKLDYRVNSVTEVLSRIMAYVKKAVKSGDLNLKDGKANR